ncbi:MAG: HAMP domain-containing protein [Magnetococcales bacterium]|nr:HAMP domain-containing protein [Magnetococcales bacterium]
MRQTSLQQKVILGYTLISALALGLSLFTLVELRTVSQQLLSGEKVITMLNHILELRRFEKNFLLYHQQEDREQLSLYLEEIKRDVQLIPSLGRTLVEYDALLPRLDDDAAAKELRILGKSLVTAAEQSAVVARRQVHEALARHRQQLLLAMVVVAVVIVLAGRSVSHWIVQPLRRIEESMASVVDGRFETLRIHSGDREIQSLTQAFNTVLKELQRRQKHLLRSEKLAALGTLMSGVAHELNNPLSNISTSCQILLEERERLEPGFCAEMLGQIDEQTLRARNIVRSLLDFSRERSFESQPLALAGLIKEVIRFSQGVLPQHIQVHIDIPPALMIVGDRQRLQQLFINLLKNAVDAIPKAGEITIRARHGSADPSAPGRAVGLSRDRWVEIEMRDSGIGIRADQMSRIFDPFFSTKPVGQGSGLGLTVVHEVVEEHEGEIVVESVPGRGSCFTIRLPPNSSKLNQSHVS